MLAILKNQGFDAIKGGGGFVDLGVEDYQLIHRSALMAPPPYEKAMKMMVFPNSSEFAPQPIPFGPAAGPFDREQSCLGLRQFTCLRQPGGGTPGGE